MKNYKLMALLACASMGLLGARSLAAPLTYTAGDLLLGFRATSGNGATKCYLVNIGPAANYTGATSAFVVPGLGNIKADLDNTFASTWINDATVFWSVSGANSSAPSGTVAGEPVRTLFASKEQLIPGTPNSTRWLRNTGSGQSGPAGKMLDMANAYEFVIPTIDPNDPTAVRNQSTANSPKARLQDTTDLNSYASYQPGGTTTNSGQPPGTSFAYFSPSIEATFASGTAGSILELYRMNPGTGSLPGDFIGTFQLNDSAVLTFTPAPAPTVIFSNATFSGSEAGGTIAVTLTRGGDLTGACSVNLSTTDGTAVGSTDYTTQTNTVVSFAINQTSQTVNVPVVNRAGFQGDRTFTASLSGGTGGIKILTPSSAAVTILDTATGVKLDSATYAVSENAGNVAVKLVRAGAGAAFSATLTTTDGAGGTGALVGTDYNVPATATVDFLAADTEKTVLVPILNRSGVQGDRTFTVGITGVTNGVTLTTPDTGTVTISDAIITGQIAFSAATYQFNPVNNQAAPNTLAITLTRTGGTGGSLSADVSVTGGTLVNGTDFDTFTNPTTVTFGDGEASKTVNLQLKSLLPTKLPGTINLGLTGASLGAQTTAVVTVVAADKVLPKLVVTAPKPGVLQGTTFSVTGTASDDKGVDHVELTINGVKQNAPLGGTATAATFNLAAVPAENGTNTIVIQAVDTSGNRSKAQTKVFTYMNLRPQFVGAYNGLLVPAVTPSNNVSGFVTLKVTTAGLFTGKVTLGGFSLPITGVFGNDGTARFNKTPATTFALVGKGKVTVQLGNLGLAIAAGKVTGTVKDGANATQANLDADLAFFDGKLNKVDDKYLVNRGLYTVVLPSKEQTPVLGHTLYPQGDGIGTITITAKGQVTLKGTLADGSMVSASAPLSQGLKAPLFAQLYKKLGSIAGVVTLDDSQTDSDLKGLDFLWLNPASATAKYYPLGWATGIKVDLLGAHYAKPALGSVLPGLHADDLVNGNATLVFSDGKLNPSPLNKSVNITVANKVTNAPATDKSFTLRLTTPTGAIAGTFTHSDSAKPAYKGVIFQKGTNAGGFGYFLSVVPKTVGAPTGESGGVSLTAKP